MANVEINYYNGSSYIQLYPKIDRKNEILSGVLYKRYSGTDTYGSSNKTILNLGVNAYFLFFTQNTSMKYENRIIGFGNCGDKCIHVINTRDNTQNERIYAQWDTNGNINFYSEISSANQFNSGAFNYVLAVYLYSEI